MKSTLLLGTLIAMGVVASALAQQENIKKYDQVSIESVLSNDRVLTNYIKCLLDKGACTKEGRELKRKCFVVLKYLAHKYSLRVFLNLFVIKSDVIAKCNCILISILSVCWAFPKRNYNHNANKTLY